jgi:plastocyanin
MRSLLAIVAMLVLAPSAYAQGGTVTAGASDVRWTPEVVPIKVGETVTWNWEGTHNVQSVTTNWSIDDYETPATYTFNAVGEYDFKCIFHPGMNGKVVVSDASGTPPPPPPPPPPSEQHWVNDQPPPTVFELVDDVPPELTSVRVEAVRNGVRARFRLSERARVSVRLLRAGVPVEAARKTFGPGPGRLTVRGRRLEGRYRVEVFARDLSGNRSAVESDRVTVR